MKKKNFISPSITASMISGANGTAVDETLLLTVLQARYVLWGILALFESMVQNHHFHLNFLHIGHLLFKQKLPLNQK
ncbi:hypothetical protein GSN03_14445 [Bacillus nitratireducens]|nr:hypothetical protein GSN03_14445 [Bacillus nitratireducens]